ncbi:P27 family phage terminase small subunit [Peribacillus psychrosaccharolyticus]|uniref:P27 family phage terminase small subunit n=1 Tax=Peribacillus psychrosaccharolyticus TaxID=1407 RepID=UPI003D2E8261
MSDAEVAYKDFLAGLKLKEIAEKHNLSVNTVKSWKRRYNWQRESVKSKVIKEKETKKGAPRENRVAPTKINAAHSKMRKIIGKDLKEQLTDKGAGHAHYLDMVNDYLALWDVKNKLIADIEERGVVVKWGQMGKKKNDSVGELNKTNAQMLKILSELGLKASERKKGDNHFGGDTNDNSGAFEDV